MKKEYFKSERNNIDNAKNKFNVIKIIVKYFGTFGAIVSTTSVEFYSHSTDQRI